MFKLKQEELNNTKNMMGSPGLMIFLPHCPAALFASPAAPRFVNYEISHVYHNFQNEADAQMREIEDAISTFYSGKPKDFMEFGDPDTRQMRAWPVSNASRYT